jgi:lipoprotein-anchoring transpeptidase ErfK/SrfK
MGMVRRWLTGEHWNVGSVVSGSRIAASLGLTIAIVVAAQMIDWSVFAGRMMPHTVIGQRSLAGLTLSQANVVLRNMAARAQVQLTIGEHSYIFTAQQLGVHYDPSATLAAAYKIGRQPGVIPALSVPLRYIYRIDTPTMTAAINTVVTQIGSQPVDANVIFAGGNLQVIPDHDGFTVDRLSLERLIDASLGQANEARVSSAPRRQTADITVAQLDTTLTSARQLIATPITLSYGSFIWTPSQADIGAWISFNKSDSGAGARLLPQVDRAKLKSYVQGLANQANIAPVNEITTVTNGATVVNQAGVNGVAIDQDGAVTNISTAVESEQPLVYAIGDSVVPFRTISTDFTTLNYPKYVEINLNKQHAWVWQDGQIIFDTPITSGATGAGFPTVTGLFSIYYKTTNTHLVGYQYGPRYSYDVSVKYWMPFYDGYGLHDASWRNGNFGGQDYWRGGSHGCVNLPDVAAAYIYNWSDVGTPVWVHK